MKRVEFTVMGESGESLRESGSIEDSSDLPVLIMRAVEDFLEAHGGQLVLPLTIHVQPSSGGLPRRTKWGVIP
jgi:hypothetical protein